MVISGYRDTLGDLPGFRLLHGVQMTETEKEALEQPRWFWRFVLACFWEL